MQLCGVEVVQDARWFPLTVDSVLLADFAAPRGRDRVLDLGCGPGWLGILMQDGCACTVDGLELLSGAAEAARENYRRCGCRGEIACGSWEDTARILPGAYDLCVCNPPYFAAGSGPAGGRHTARSLPEGGERAVCAAAARALRNGGTFCLILPCERAVDWLCALRAAGLEPKMCRATALRRDRAPDRLLLRCKKGGRPGLRMQRTLVRETASGRPTAELCRIYKGMNEE